MDFLDTENNRVKWTGSASAQYNLYPFHFCSYSRKWLSQFQTRSLTQCWAPAIHLVLRSVWDQALVSVLKAAQLEGKTDKWWGEDTGEEFYPVRKCQVTQVSNPELPLEGWLGAGRSGEEGAPSLQGWQHEGRDRERSLEVESPTLKERW